MKALLAMGPSVRREWPQHGALVSVEAEARGFMGGPWSRTSAFAIHAATCASSAANEAKTCSARPLRLTNLTPASVLPLVRAR